MQTQLLDAEEVFAVRDALWDVGRVGVCRGFSVSIRFHKNDKPGSLRGMTYSSESSSIRTGLLSSVSIKASFSSLSELLNSSERPIHIGSSQHKTKERERGVGGGEEK